MVPPCFHVLACSTWDILWWRVLGLCGLWSSNFLSGAKCWSMISIGCVGILALTCRLLNLELIGVHGLLWLSVLLCGLIWCGVPRTDTCCWNRAGWRMLFALRVTRMPLLVYLMHVAFTCVFLVCVALGVALRGRCSLSVVTGMSRWAGLLLKGCSAVIVWKSLPCTHGWSITWNIRSIVGLRLKLKVGLCRNRHATAGMKRVRLIWLATRPYRLSGPCRDQK